MESLLVAKMERAALELNGMVPGTPSLAAPCVPCPETSSSLPPAPPPAPPPGSSYPGAPYPQLPALLLRTDSTDSASSFSSASSDVCRCDDCLLGTADVWANRKKVPYLLWMRNLTKQEILWCRPQESRLIYIAE